MWTLTKRFRFEAAHHLPRHEGKCRRVHGHSWQGEVEVAGTTLHETGSQTGMVLDFDAISTALRPLIADVLDHHDLNETTGLPDPTSEALAQFVFDRLHPLLPDLVAVTIDETCTSRCRYAPVRV